MLSRERFDRISAGKETPLDALVASAFRAFALGSRTGVDDVPSLARFNSLTYLSLRIDDKVDVPGVRALLESPHLPALRTLDVHETSVDAAGAAALGALRSNVTIHVEWTQNL